MPSCGSQEVTTIAKEFGAVAILDALGASTYSDRQIGHFLDSRDRVLSQLKEWAEGGHGSVKPTELKAFTFNDTIVLVLRCGAAAANLERATALAAYLRQFLVNSMVNGMLFRGSAALGSFYIDGASNTVMGEAVTDAAQWYERSDWVGVHFTPRSFLTLGHMMRAEGDDKRWAFLPYSVPLRDGGLLPTLAVNWPKIFLVPKLRPWGRTNVEPKQKLLELLSAHSVPLGTERKYFNTIEFFDRSLAVEDEIRRSRKRRVSKKR